MKNIEEIKKFRQEILESLATARPENIGFLQGVIYGLDYPLIEEPKDNSPIDLEKVTNGQKIYEMQTQYAF